jgi:hypothetical protein
MALDAQRAAPARAKNFFRFARSKSLPNGARLDYAKRMSV